MHVFGKSLHQQEYRILQKGLEAGLSKQQISNLLHAANISLTNIDTFSGVRNGNIRTDFYDDSQDIPDTSALDSLQQNMLLLYDWFLGKQNKAEAYYTRGGHNSCDTIYIAENYFRQPRHKIRENSNIIILFPQDLKNLAP